MLKAYTSTYYNSGKQFVHTATLIIHDFFRGQTEVTEVTSKSL